VLSGPPCEGGGLCEDPLRGLREEGTPQRDLLRGLCWGGRPSVVTLWGTPHFQDSPVRRFCEGGTLWGPSEVAL